MVDAAPLSALRYDPATVGSLAAASAPAYDLIDPMAYAQHRTANPYTVLELLAPDDAYDRSAQLFRQWRRSGVLVPEKPAFFRYEEHEILRGDGAPMLNVQRGILAAVRLEVTGRGAVLAHEEVDEQRVSARLRRLEAVPAELDPVYMVLENPPPELSHLLTSEPDSPPVVATSDEQGTDHRIWALRDPEIEREVRRLLGGCRAMIADGHHRYARSLAYRDRRRAAGVRASEVADRPSILDGRTGPEPPWERVFAYLVDPRAGGPRIEPMHRLITPVSERSISALLEDFSVSEGPADPRALLALLDELPERTFGLVLPGGHNLVLRVRDDAALLARLPAERRGPWRHLDAAVLLHAVLPRLELAPGSVRARADVETAAAEVTRSRDAALLVLRAPRLADVLELASVGERLPYKSTRFVPKPRTGLLIRPLDEGLAPVP